MPNCVVRNCHNYTSKTRRCARGITFHKVKRLLHEKRVEWIKFIRKSRNDITWMPSEYSSICSAHFRKDDFYITKCGRRYLRKTAAPVDDPKTAARRPREVTYKEALIMLRTENEATSRMLLSTPEPTRTTRCVSCRIHAVNEQQLSDKNKKLIRQNRCLQMKNMMIFKILKKFKETLENLTVKNVIKELDINLNANKMPWKNALIRKLEMTSATD